MEKKIYDALSLSDEEIDGIMRRRIELQGKKGVKPQVNGWTDEELELRDSVCMSLLTRDCKSRHQASLTLSKRWNISKGTANKYIAEALTRFTKQFTDNLPELRKMYLERCQTILETAIRDGQKDTALKALAEYGKVLGFNKETKDVNLSGDATINFQFDSD
jgi:hypothetical protein